MRRALALAVAATALLAAPRGRIGPGQFMDFPLSVQLPGVTALVLGGLGLVAGLAAFGARRRGVRAS